MDLLKSRDGQLGPQEKNPTRANNGYNIFKWLKKRSFDGTQDYMKFKFQYLKIKFHSSPI